MAEIYNRDEVLRISNNSNMEDELLDEVIKCVPYAWILINHYRLRNFIDNKKLSKKDLSEPMPFFVEILDFKHPHVRGQYIHIGGTKKHFYKKMYADKISRRDILFINKHICGYSLEDLKMFVFNKNCKKNIASRLMSDVGRTGDKSSAIIKDLANDKSAAVIRNSKDRSLIEKGVYAETIFKIEYAGTDTKKVEWLYPYPKTDEDIERLTKDTLDLLDSFKIKVSQYADEVDKFELNDAFKNRY